MATSTTIPDDLPTSATANAMMDTKSTNLFTTNDDIPVLSGIALKGLRFAPPEVREMIFANVFPKYVRVDSNHVNELYPALLAALRGDQPLYREAMAVYSKTSTFRGKWDQGTPGIAIPFEVISKLDMDFGSDTLVSHEQYPYGRGPGVFEKIIISPSTYIQKLLSNAINVTELSLDFTGSFYEFSLLMPHEKYHRTFDNIAKCFQRFAKLKKVTITSCNCQSGFTFDGKCPVPYPDFISFFNEGLGFRGYLKMTPVKSTFLPSLLRTLFWWETECVWEAEAGEVLEWNTRRHASSVLGSGLGSWWMGIVG